VSDVQVRRVSLTFVDAMLILCGTWAIVGSVVVVGLKIANAIEANTAAIKESAK